MLEIRLRPLSDGAATRFLRCVDSIEHPSSAWGIEFERTEGLIFGRKLNSPLQQQRQGISWS